MKPLVGYLSLAPDGSRLVGERGALYDYVLGGNGVFAVSERKGLFGLIPVGAARVVGLPTIKPIVQLTPKVPAKTVEVMFRAARAACTDGLREILFHLELLDPPQWGQYAVTVPNQDGTAYSITPRGPTAGTTYETALIDVHSHHLMKAPQFSPMDDASEAGLFRIFGLLFDIFERPTLRTRLTIFNHTWEFDPRLAFEIPAGVHTPYDHAGP